MTEQAPAPVVAPTPTAKPPAAEANGQLIVALAIVLGLVAVALLLAHAGKNDTAVGAIIGALATALNAPTGIGNVLRANKGADQ